MIDLPEWMLNPNAPDAEARMTEDLSGAIARKHLELALQNDPDADPEKLAQHPRLQADVAFEVMQLTAQNQSLADRALRHQAITIAESGLYRQHANEYEEAEDFFREALSDTDRSPSEASDLAFYATRALQYMKEHGLAGAMKLWVKGKNVAKARAAKPILKKLMDERDNAPTDSERYEVEQRIDKILEQVIDESVSYDKFVGQKHGSGLQDKPRLSIFPGWRYVLPSGTVVVLALTDEAQREFVESSLGGFADWHLGTGDEPILNLIVNRVTNP